jgi:hypothetical protein
LDWERGRDIAVVGKVRLRVDGSDSGIDMFPSCRWVG